MLVVAFDWEMGGIDACLVVAQRWSHLNQSRHDDGAGLVCRGSKNRVSVSRVGIDDNAKLLRQDD